jgi:hypothetical protein
MLTLNGLCAAHGVVVPMQCEYFALEGLTDLVNTIKQVHANLNKDLKIIGLLRVMFDPRITLQVQVSDQLKDHFADKVFNAVIPRNVRLAEAPSYGLPGVVFDPSAKGSQAYIDFAQEMVSRVQNFVRATREKRKWLRKKPKGLGRGLEALLGPKVDDAAVACRQQTTRRTQHIASGSNGARHVPAPHPHGRRRFV